MSEMDDVIKQLERRGTLRASSSPDEDGQKQKRQFDDLVARAENSDSKRKFLCHYDATLRLIEVILLQYGYLLDQQPHATARQIVAVIDPNFDFRELSNIRHDAKKANITPPDWALSELLKIQQQILQIAQAHF
jgi:hypothetical protein